MPVRDQDHRVIARAVARTFLGGAKKRGDFVAGEVIAETRFVGHANNLAQPPSPSSPRREPRAEHPAHKKAHRPLAMSLFLQTGFQGVGTGNRTPKGLPVAQVKGH